MVQVLIWIPLWLWFERKKKLHWCESKSVANCANFCTMPISYYSNLAQGFCFVFLSIKSLLKPIMWKSKWINPTTNHSNLYLWQQIKDALTYVNHHTTHGSIWRTKCQEILPYVSKPHFLWQNVGKTTSKTNKAFRCKAETFVNHKEQHIGLCFYFWALMVEDKRVDWLGHSMQFNYGIYHRSCTSVLEYAVIDFCVL